MTIPISRRRWFRLTPDKLLVALLALEGILFLSESNRWFAFSERKGWTVLIAVASVGLAILLMSVCYAFSLVFHWRFQFSLRSLPVLVVVVAILCSWLAAERQRAERQRLAVEAIQNAGGEVGYSDDSGQSIWHDHPPPGATWLRKLLGDEFFSDIIEVYFGFGGTTDAVLVHCGGLKQLQILWLGGTTTTGPRNRHGANRPHEHGNDQVTDVGLASLKGLTNLRELGLGGSKITDAGLKNLRGWHRLQQLVLNDTDLTDAGLENLEGLTQLQFLDLSKTNITAAGVMKLQRALPKCQIMRDPVLE